MAKRDYLQRYGLIINYLRRGKASFKDISTYLERESEIHSYDFTLSQRTFQREIKEIYSAHGIEIKCIKSSGLYYIAEEEDNNSNLQLLEAFNLYNALNLTDNYQSLIEFEPRRPKGTENLFGLLHAIKNRNVISFNYKKFYAVVSENRVVEPLLIKEFKGRFYLLAFDQSKKDIRTFGLDRLSDLSIERNRFTKHSDFNAKNYFQNAFGIIAPQNTKPEKIVLSFVAEQGQYIKSYPLHHSQTIKLETKKELQIELSIMVTYDFVMEVLSYGSDVIVISPKKLINQINSIYVKLSGIN